MSITPVNVAAASCAAPYFRSIVPGGFSGPWRFVLRLRGCHSTGAFRAEPSTLCRDRAAACEE